MTNRSRPWTRPAAARTAPSCVVLLALCVASASCRAARAEPRLISPTAVVLETPLVAQDELYECGLVAISALCGYYRVEIPESERAWLVRTAARHQGLSGGELRAALERRGFEVFLFEGTLDRSATGLARHVESGRPLIVMTRERGAHHYSLFIGVDDELDNVVLLDPRRGRVVLPTRVFERLWVDARRFTLLALPAPPDAVEPGGATSRPEEGP